MKTHYVKCDPEYYERLLSGDKNFEVRLNDRDYQTGDRFVPQWFDRKTQKYGEDHIPKLNFKITYVLHGGDFGIEKGYCVLALSDC